ncbi:hypothetical protein ABZ930_08075 [Streptomyces sp. NPDC046716]|uniref:hypothetical protein n=1 Tax=Streptomyces sp. NPDC046716 TaxID=3157093 RepID=UPI0033E5E5BD
MSNSRRIRLTLASAVLGLGAVTAVASTAGAATPSDDAQPSAAQPAGASGTQDMQLSDGSVAHVTDLGDGQFQAWVTHNGTRIASLSSGHPSAHVGGHTYELNQANGFVGVTDASGWHSESDIAKPGNDSHHQDQRDKHRTGPVKHTTKHQAVGTTHNVSLPGGSVAHTTRLSGNQWQSWITHKGVRIASLDNAHHRAHTHGWTYNLNGHTGVVTAHK